MIVCLNCTPPVCNCHENRNQSLLTAFGCFIKTDAVRVCHSHENGNPRLLKKSFYSLRLFYKNRRSLKRNNVRGYINIKHGFPPDKNTRVQAAKEEQILKSRE
jgi:hypothetical protein